MQRKGRVVLRPDSALSAVFDTEPAFQCPTICEPRCPVPCHEVHVAPERRAHDADACWLVVCYRIPVA